MDDDPGYEDDAERDDAEVHDTAPMDIPVRASTSCDWPPEPPPPADPIARGSVADMGLAAGTMTDLDAATDPSLAVGTAVEFPEPRRASIYAAVRRPTTSSEPT